MKKEWRFINSEKQVMYCERCGEEEPLAMILGKRLEFAVGILNAFSDAHAYCEERDGKP